MWINWDNSQQGSICETPSIKCMVHGWLDPSMIMLWDGGLELPWDYLPKVQITKDCGNRAYMPRKRTNNLMVNFPLLVFNVNLSQITLYYVQSCLWLLSLPFSLSHLDDEGNIRVLCRSDCLVHPIACLQVFPRLQEHRQNSVSSLKDSTKPTGLLPCVNAIAVCDSLLSSSARAVQKHGQDRQQFECFRRNVLQESPAVRKDPSDLVSRTH